MLQIGSLVDNKYKILSEVGHGGMSVVYLAINERANKTWAVKEIRKDGVCNFEAVKQGLVVETDMLKKLNHDHLPSIIDVIDMDDSFIIVMDYIEGKSLQDVLEHGGAQPQDLVIQWGIQLCDVLGYLHSREPAIIYRDMKPANVMLRPNGDVTLIDFGTAREFKDRNMVEDTTCLGTRGYAAPEQFGGRGQTDARTDIYCLGATLYHLITGHSPAEPPYEIKPLSYWNPGYAGSGLEYIISKCCQQDPAHRYQNCAELMYDLEHVGDMDYHTIRSRKLKWNAFLASVLVCLVSIFGMIGTTLLKNSATAETYTQYLENARQQFAEGSNEEAFNSLRQAVSVDPGLYDAYDLLMDNIEEDGTLDQVKELPQIKKLTNENIEALRDIDPEGYSDIQFRIGRLLFLLTDNQDSQLKSAANYFENALANGSMEASSDEKVRGNARLANSMATIGNYIGHLGRGTGSAFLDDEANYRTLWEDLQTLYQDNPLETVSNAAIGVSLYSRIANMAYEHYQGFLSEGITLPEMEDFMAQLEQTLQAKQESMGEIAQNSEYQKLFADAYGNIATVRQVLLGAAEKGGG